MCDIKRQIRLEKIIIIIIIILYPWVYSPQGLKATKTVLVWLLVQIVLGIEGVVQKNCTESLQPQTDAVTRMKFLLLRQTHCWFYDQGPR